MDTNKILISVGEIINTQGHRGEVRVWPLTDFPERFKENTVLMCEKGGVITGLTIEKVRPQKNFFVIKFKEIADMNAAEDIVGSVIKINPDELTELPADTYYIFDIIGMNVVTDEGQELGAVRDVIQTGSNDVYIVKGTEKEYMIPALKEVVLNIDKDAKRIVIKPLNGLLDL